MEDDGPAFERIVKVTGAFDKRDSDPQKNYGIGACRIWFILKGPVGAIQFQIGTNWFLPAIQRERREWQHNYENRFDVIHPQGWDVGYHAIEPQYEVQEDMECDLFGRCYYDGSGLRADNWIPNFIEGGTDWLWPALETEYYERFGADAMLKEREKQS